MNMSNERTLEVEVLGTRGPVPGHLYVRFEPDGSFRHLILETDSMSVEVSELDFRRASEEAVRIRPNHLLMALTDGLLPVLPPGSSLRFRHSVILLEPSGKPQRCILIEEIAPSQVEDVSLLRFTLRCDVEGRAYSASDPEDFQHAIIKLCRETRRIPRICACCEYASLYGRGGDDWRHGLHCFRDTPGDPRTALISALEESDVARVTWSNVDGFHWCPSFTPARWVLGAIEKPDAGQPNAAVNGSPGKGD